MKLFIGTLSIVLWITSLFMIESETFKIVITGYILLILSSLVILILFGVDDGFDGIDFD